MTAEWALFCPIHHNLREKKWKFPKAIGLYYFTLDRGYSPFPRQ